ncbi:MAG: iron-sulfur cluster carrier protein ApbC [Gammaproteobacteria bacterium]|nr:iron-sulfur cluster carrier protein ApbC [Gammaproteobacteria bacterium]
MTSSSTDQVREILARVKDTHLDTDLVSAGAVRDVAAQGRGVRIALEFGYPAAGYHAQLKSEIEREVGKLPGIGAVSIEFSTRIVAHAVQRGVKPLQHIRNTIAVASGKGGVGKSTVATNLALALQAEGAKAGILDADIYGPSQPRMLGCREKPDSADGRKLEPNVSFGIQSMSIGYLVDEEQPMIWRGPMVTSALEQLLNDTAWKDLDYLVIDLPPGTGDIQLTLCQKIPVSGAVIVTTPQDIALLDARKALKMFEKVQVPVLGIVENMSTHICSNCGHEEHIFGSGGGQRMAEQYKVDLLGSLPLDIRIREGVDNGRPTVAVEPESGISLAYRDIARRTAAKLSMRAKDFSAKFPKIVVENT